MVIDDGSGQEQLDASASTDNSQPEITAPAEQAPDTGNPAWAPLREKLPDGFFKTIEPDLKNWDKEAQSRIESLTTKFKPFQEMLDAGHTPETIQVALNVAQQLNESPEKIYESLGKFLEQTGRMPTKAELKEQIEEDAEDDVPEPASDPRLDEIAKQQEQIKQFFETQQQQQMQQQADAALDAEITKLKENHKDFTDADIQEVIRRAAFMAEESRAAGKNRVPTLEEAATGYLELRNRILSTNRPGDSAPKLVPASGGVPSSGEKRTLGSLSRQETQDLLAGLITQSKQR